MYRKIETMTRGDEVMASHTKAKSSAQLLRLAFLEILAVLVALAVAGRAKAQPRKIEPSDIQRIVGVSELAISPDGKSIVIIIIVSRVNWVEDRYDSLRRLNKRRAIFIHFFRKVVLVTARH